MRLFGAATAAGFVANLALGRSFSVVGHGPLHQAPVLLAAWFETIALFMSLRLN